MPFTTFSAALLTGGAITAASPVVAQALIAPSADIRFAAISERYIDSIARFSPVCGTQLGDHRFDDKLPDITAAGRAIRRRSTEAMLGSMARGNRLQDAEPRQSGRFAPAAQDRLDYDLWDIEVLKSWSWNAQNYNDNAARRALQSGRARLRALARNALRPRPRGWRRSPPSCSKPGGN